MHDALSLANQIAVITGGTRGIGLAVARLLASHGADLVIGARSDQQRADDVAAQIQSEFGVKVCSVVGDVSHSNAADALARCAFDVRRRIDIWVNNAGILQDGLIGMVPERDVDKVVDVNLKGVIHGVQASARVMRRTGGGSIINISSIIGRVGNAGQLVYGAAKAGVIGATLSAAKELAPMGIRVNAIAPGFISTDMTAQLPPEKIIERLSGIGMGRAGTGEDVAGAALFLASGLSKYVTGQVIGVDGGMLV